MVSKSSMNAQSCHARNFGGQMGFKTVRIMPILGAFQPRNGEQGRACKWQIVGEIGMHNGNASQQEHL
jgi:hypothetical protein